MRSSNASFSYEHALRGFYGFVRQDAGHEWRGCVLACGDIGLHGSTACSQYFSGTDFLPFSVA